MCDCCISDTFNTITCVNNHTVCYKCRVQYLKNFSSSDCMYCNPLNHVILIKDSNNLLTRSNRIICNRELLIRFCLIVLKLLTIVFYIALFMFSTFYCTKTINYISLQNRNKIIPNNYWITFDNFIEYVFIGLFLIFGIIMGLVCALICIYNLK